MEFFFPEIIFNNVLPIKIRCNGFTKIGIFAFKILLIKIILYQFQWLDGTLPLLVVAAKATDNVITAAATSKLGLEPLSNLKGLLEEFEGTYYIKFSLLKS